MRLLPIMLGSLIVFGSGCATIISGSTQRVSIASVPEGASFTIHRANPREKKEGIIDEAVVIPEATSVASAVTPGEVVLRREYDYAVRFQKAGYAESAVPLCRTRAGNPWVFGNLIFIPGIVVDMVNEPVQHKLEDGVNATLQPATAGEAPTNSSDLVCRPRSPAAK